VAVYNYKYCSSGCL